jgi:hypothetical protein
MRKVLLSSIAVCLCSLFFLSGCRAQEMTLVQNGQPNTQIVISANASTTEKYAAQELQNTLQKISGAQLPILNSLSKSTFNIVIGTPQSMPEIKAANLFNIDNPEETRIVARGKVLFLAGPTPRAALYAVYTFLQDQLNCRWYWPGESGEYLPMQKTITIDNLDIRQTPDIQDRSLSIDAPHYDEDTLIWMARNRMNWHHLQGGTITPEHIADLHEKGLQVVLGGHNIVLPTELLKKHPEYLAMYGGKRQFPVGVAAQLCWGNKDVQRAVAEEIENWWQKYPDVDSISFLAADQTHFCEDELCKALAPDVSTRWQKFCAAVMAQVNQKYPGKKYQALAYQDYRNVPTQVAPFSLIGYTTYNINYTKPITDPSNDKARAEMEAWQKLGGNMEIRGYQFIPFREPMFAPIEPLIVQEINWAHQTGLKGWKSEVIPYGYPKNTLPQDQNWVTNRMALYAVAQAMWNSKIDPAAITRDWSEHVFGPAAEPMLDYYELMDRAWVNSPKALSYFQQPPASFVNNFISDDLLKKADADFQNAKTDLNKLTDEAAKKRIIEQINLEAAMLDNWRKVLLLQQGRAERFKAYAPIAATTPQVTAQADDPAWKNVQPLPDFEDGKNQPAAEPTKVLLQWNQDALYLRFICDDKNISQLKTTAKTHDSNVFGDDAIELFLDDPSIQGHYFHIAINAKNISYDAKADGAMNFDKSWNPQFTSKTSIGTNSWILDVKLPFSSFGINAKENAHWKMSFKRDGASRRSNTGWPDASYHNPAGFGTVELVDKIPQQKRVLIYDAGHPKDALLAAFRKLGFTVSDVPQTETDFKSTFAKGVDAITLFRPSTGGFALSDDVIKTTVLPFLQQGGLVLIAGNGNMPLDKWFGSDAAVKWSGWKIDPNRKSTFVLDGDWQKTPNDLSRVLKTGVTPASGFLPVSDSWQILAKMRMANGDDMPYLLSLKIGKGTLILTSSNFGYGGGYEMFGNQNPANAAKLVDNLLAETKK